MVTLDKGSYEERAVVFPVCSKVISPFDAP
jgi:hypothetical protein